MFLRRGPSPAVSVLLAFVLAACAPRTSSSPLGAVPPEVADLYYYGPAQPVDTTKQDERAEKLAARKPKAPQKPREAEKAPKKPGVGSSKQAPGGPLDAAAAAVWAGMYLGTDRVRFAMGPLPAEPQVDDAAKLRVDQAGATTTFTVVDSSNGKDLCTLSGPEPTAGRVELDAGEDCFAGMLGVPMTTALASGYAALNGDKLEVRFELEVVVETEALDLDGTIEYEFDGQRED